jgi:hypothetical protein
MNARRRPNRASVLKRLAQAPITPSLEEAFEAVENLDARHPTSRGTHYGNVIGPAARGNRSTLA